jgi:hypothetical protein
VPSRDRRHFLCCAAACAGVTQMAANEVLAVDADADERARGERRVQAQRSEAHSRAIYGKRLVERLGKGVLAAVEEVTLELGRAFGREAGTGRRGLNGLVELWKAFPPTIAYAVDELTPTTLRMRVTRCVFAEAMREQDAAELGYAYYCHSDFGFAETYDPEIGFERTKTLMQGNDCCDPAYRLRQRG